VENFERDVFKSAVEGETVDFDVVSLNRLGQLFGDRRLAGSATADNDNPTGVLWDGRFTDLARHPPIVPDSLCFQSEVPRMRRAAAPGVTPVLHVG